MLRSAFHASLACLANPSLPHPKLPRTSNLRSLASLALPHRNQTNKPTGITGSITQVLEILGPFDHIFPTSDVSFYVALLRRCIKTGNFFMGGLVHSHLIKHGLEPELLVSNVLLDMYAKLGCLCSSVKLFDEMRERDLVSWCTLISGFVGHGLGLEACRLFKRMFVSGLRPNQFVLSSFLKGCSLSGVLELGLTAHGLVIKIGVGFDRFVEIGLVGVYAKCGVLDDARKTFYEIPVKSPVSWNAMISGYVENGCLLEAVELCQEMCRIGFVMDLVTLRVVASVASAMKMLGFCKNLHVYSIKIGFDADSFVVAELVKLLTKLREVAYMEKLFTAVRKPDASLYSLLISAYHSYGHRLEAIKLAEDLLYSPFNQCQGALVSVLNLCLSKAEGTQVHARIVKTGHLSYVSIGNALISMYSDFGEMEYANMTFSGMLVRDVVTWTAIIAGLVHNLQFGKALDFFCACRNSGIQLDQHTIVTTINACMGLRSIDKGKQMHALAFKHGVDLSDFIRVSLLQMYAKCGHIDSAARFFSYTSIPHNLIITNVMLAGYCWNLQPERALELFGREHQSGLVPDEFSFSTVLGACADIGSVVMGEQLHCCIAKSGLEFSDPIIGNAIINFYLKSRNIASACKFFYSMKMWNLNTYSTLIFGYLQNAERSEDLPLFYQMQQTGLRAYQVAFSRILRGCPNFAAIHLGKQIHASIIKLGFVSGAYVRNRCMSMHVKCGAIDRVGETSGEITMRDDVIDKPMVAQDSQDRNKERTFKVLQLFKYEEETQNYCSYVDVVNISSTADVSKMKGTSFVAHGIPNGLKANVSVGSPNINGFRNHRISKNSWKVLDKNLSREVVLWNSMASEYAKNSCASVDLLEAMQVEGIISHNVIYLVVFSPYNHADLVNERSNSFKLRNKSWLSDHRIALCLGAA